MDKLCPNRIPYRIDHASISMVGRRDGQMNHPAATSALSHPKPLPIGRLVFIAIALLTVIASGCSRLRLPAIDPTGSRIVYTVATTTGIACLARMGKVVCFGCTRGLGCLNCLGTTTANTTSPSSNFQPLRLLSRQLHPLARPHRRKRHHRGQSEPARAMNRACPVHPAMDHARTVRRQFCSVTNAG